MQNGTETRRMNIAVPEDLHRAAKISAAMAGQTLQDWMVAAIEAATKSKTRGKASA